MAVWLRPQPGTDFRLLSFPDAPSVSSLAWRRSREMPRLGEDTRKSRSGVLALDRAPHREQHCGNGHNPLQSALFIHLRTTKYVQEATATAGHWWQLTPEKSAEMQPDSGRSRFNCRQYQPSILFDLGTARLRIVCNRSHRYCSADSTKGNQKVWSVLARGNGGKSTLHSAGRSHCCHLTPTLEFHSSI